MADLYEEVDESGSPQGCKKPTSNLLPKAIFLTAIALLLPLFPSQAPEFLSETLLTKSWELLHLVLVGIAISYGLFSTRNFDRIEEEHPSKLNENSHAYVSNIFQVWSSQHRREDSTVVVADGDGAQVESSRVLLLPLRSLKGTSEERRRGDDDVIASPIPWRSKMLCRETETTLETQEKVNDEASLKKQTMKKNKKAQAPPPPPPPPPPSFSYKTKLYGSFNGEQKNPPESFYRLGRSVRTVKPREELKDEEESKESDVDSADSREAIYEAGESKEGDDVDKKADEFIAKFREQIRLQRIENMKRSSAGRRKT